MKIPIRLKNINRINKETMNIYVDNMIDDDWIKYMPGYKTEIEIHEELSKKHAQRIAND